ncbi:hypothetical protein PMAYCL1PPCAC_08673, partial [Pristionchus mayeri]
MRAWHKQWMPIMERYRAERIRRAQEYRHEAAAKASMILEEASRQAFLLSNLPGGDCPEKNGIVKGIVT